MASCDVEDNHSLMKLHTHKLETQSFQKMYDCPRYLDNKGRSQLSQEQKCSPIIKKMQFLQILQILSYEMTAGIILKYSSWS